MTRARKFLTLLCVWTVVTTAPAAQEQKQTADKAGLPADSMMKKWLDFMSPSAGHKRLEGMAGSWETVTKTWWEGADKKPVESRGTADVRWILGGRYLQTDFRSEMMGMPVEGTGIIGFDNMNRKYVMSWIDNMGTSLLTANGNSDTAGTVFTFFGTMDELMTGEHDKTVKYVYRMHGRNSYTFEIHDMTIPEPNTKVVEIVYTRKAK